MLMDKMAFYFLILANLLLFFSIINFFLLSRKSKEIKEKNFKLPAMIRRRIKIDSAFSLKEKKEIYKALKTWKNITCGLFDFAIVDSNVTYIDIKDGYNTILFLKGDPSDSLIKAIDNIENAKIYGYAYFNFPNIILIVPKRLKSLHDFKNILIHEIGHLLNIAHIKDKRSIMHMYYDGHNNISQQDLIAFLSVCQWDWESVKRPKDPFWIQVESKYSKKRLKRFYEYKK